MTTVPDASQSLSGIGAIMTTVPDASQSLLDVIKTNDLLAVRQHITIGGASVDEENCLLYSIAHDLHDVASFLISCGADCNVTDQAGTNSLHYAARANNVLLMRELCDAGANAGACDKNGITPLHLASLYGSCQAVEYLLESTPVDPTIRTPLGISAVDLAVNSLLRRTKGLFTPQTTLDEIMDFRFDVKLMSKELFIKDPTILNIADNPQVKRLQRVIQLLEVSLFACAGAWEYHMAEP